MVTDRGEPVAEVRRPGESRGPTDYPRLNQLIRDGVVRVAEPNAPDNLYRIAGRPKLRSTSAEDLLAADREDR